MSEGTDTSKIDDLAMKIGFAGRSRNDVSEDALEWWSYTGEARRNECRKMAQVALETRDKWIARDAYIQGVQEAARLFREHGNTDVILALIQKDNTDE